MGKRKGMTGTPMHTVRASSQQRKRRKQRAVDYTSAGPLTVTHPDGTKTTDPALSPKELRRLVNKTEPRGWRPQINDPERRVT